MTPEDLRHMVSEAGIVPILMASSSDAAAAVDQADALVKAGASMIEVLFRNPNAPAALGEIRRRHPRLLLAAGTILDAEGAARAVAAGANLMVSPGFSPALHAAAQGAGIPLVPGVNTASEVQQARELGYLVQKFYPAWDHGHLRLPEFASIYPEVCFLVTGGLVSASVADYAHHSNVAALGGTWMVKSRADTVALATDINLWRNARRKQGAGNEG
jgi:2-dehydro-3-deoxyphosphogluconate aldolase/(4S)-4-hydroxy-2-oxoglutarate aldolase